MMYSKAMFGQELKKRVDHRQNVIEIGVWAYSTYLNHCEDLEPGLRNIMLGLNTMELGEQFALSYEVLNKIADDLIAGKLIDLDSTTYQETSE